MRWFRRGRRARSGGRAAADINDDAGAGAEANAAPDDTAASIDLDEVIARLETEWFEAESTTCATCGRALDGDPDEDLAGDAGRPICGECARERDFFVMDIADGELDGRIG